MCKGPRPLAFGEPLETEWSRRVLVSATQAGGPLHLALARSLSPSPLPSPARGEGEILFEVLPYLLIRCLQRPSTRGEGELSFEGQGGALLSMTEAVRV